MSRRRVMIEISNLRASLKGKVIGPDDPGYDDARRVFFTGFDHRPAVDCLVARGGILAFRPLLRPSGECSGVSGAGQVRR